MSSENRAIRRHIPCRTVSVPWQRGERWHGVRLSDRQLYVRHGTCTRNPGATISYSKPWKLCRVNSSSLVFRSIAVAVLRGWGCVKILRIQRDVLKEGMCCIIRAFFFFCIFACCKVCWLASTPRRKSQTDGAWTAGKASSCWCKKVDEVVIWMASLLIDTKCCNATAMLWQSLHSASFSLHPIGAR